MKKELKKKLAGYAAMTGAALVILPACKKDNPNVNPANSISKNNLSAPVNDYDSCQIDFDGDGNIDISISVNSYQDPTSNYGYADVYGQNSGMVLTNSGSTTIGTYTYNYDAVQKLSKGSDIGPNVSTFKDYGVLGVEGTFYGYPVSAGQFLGSEGYVGVSFMSAGNTHYGWVKVSVNANAKTANITEAAFEIRPNTAIKAGVK